MDKDILEVVIKKSYKDSKIKRILDIKVESAVPKGENYGSTILRVTLKVVLGNGRLAKKSYIAKKENTGEAADQFRNDLNLFNKEVSIYINILREMDLLIEEFEDTEGPIWCEFIHYSPSDSTIILQDLKASGFTTVKRTEAQDLDHARLVLRNLGRFHAMAKVLEERGLISKDDYKPSPTLNEDVYIQNTLYGGILALIKGMRAAWGEEWAEFADKLSQVPFEDYSKRVKESRNFDDNAFKCLNHGDCWNNNMMFKHDWEGNPIDLRLIDFQVPQYNSPCVDVTYFMYTSIKSSVRRQNLKGLIELYHASLASSLERFGYEGSKPTLGDINNAMERLSYFGLIFFLALFPTILTARTDAVDLDLIFKTNGEEGYDISVYYEEGIIEKIGEDLKRFVKLQES